MLRLLLTGKLLLFTTFIFAQNFLEQGAENASLGNACTTKKDGNSLFFNPGIVLDSHKVNLSLNYSNWLKIKGFDRTGLSVLLPVKKMTCSYGLQYEGWNYYRSLRNTLGVSMTLSDHLSFGISGSIQRFDFGSSYGRLNAVCANVGLLYTYNQNVHFGVAVFNLKKNRSMGFEPTSLENLLRIGSSFQIQRQSTLFLDLCAQPKTGIYASVGYEYKFSKQFAFLMGLRSLNKQLSFGFTYSRKHGRFHFGTQYIQRLGWITQIGIARL